MAGTGLALVLQVLVVAGCDQASGDRPAAITWDRDTCEYCRMVISDRAYAAEIWVESQHRYYKFDDFGCMVNWLRASGLAAEDVRLWVADHHHRDQVHWLDARAARYQQGQATPMDYGIGATAGHVEGDMDFGAASLEILNREKRR